MNWNEDISFEQVMDEDYSCTFSTLAFDFNTLAFENGLENIKDKSDVECTYR